MKCIRKILLVLFQFILFQESGVNVYLKVIFVEELQPKNPQNKINLQHKLSGAPSKSREKGREVEHKPIGTRYVCILT